VDEAVARFLAARERETARTWKPHRTPSADHAAEKTGEIPALEAGGGLAPRLATRVGTALHAVMEDWDFSDPAEARRLLEAAAPRSAEPPFSPADVLEPAREILDTLLASGLPAYLAGVEIVGREVPILLRDDDTTVHGYLDLLYRRADGRYVVADYKSDTVRESAAGTAAAYRDQLTDYGVAVRRAFGLEEMPVLEAILLRTGQRVEVKPRDRAAD
jgi:ATP-dependent exoDNAse (exonuclease V) beta subunit